MKIPDDKQLNKLLNFADDSGLAIFDELQELNERLDDVGGALNEIDIIKGDKGEPGKDGPEGRTGPRGLQGEPGREGYDGYDGKDSTVPGPVGPAGKDGKQGSPDSPTDIKIKLESLVGESRLDASAIKNLPDMVGKLAKDGYPRGLPQPAASMTYRLNGAQVGRGNNLNITGSGVTAISLDDGITYNITGGGGGVNMTEGAPTQASAAYVDGVPLSTNYYDYIPTPTTGLKFYIGDAVLQFVDATTPIPPIFPVDLAGVWGTAFGAFRQIVGGVNEIADGDTITIGIKTYTWQAILTNVDGNIQLGLNDGVSINNLKLAIGLTGTAGVDYAAAMTINTEVVLDNVGIIPVDELHILTILIGTAGNGLATTAVIASGNYAWDSPVTGGGTDPTLTQIANSFGGGPLVFIADGKAMYWNPFDQPDPTKVRFGVQRPGLYGNGILTSSDNNLIFTFDQPATLGGANNGTIGAIGDMRKGPAQVASFLQFSALDCIFLCIDPNVWIIDSSAFVTVYNYFWVPL